MQLERFDPARHYLSFASWYAKYSPSVMGPEFLPKVGFVVPEVAMGFLFQTDSALCYLEGLVTNPNSDRAARSEALDLIVKAVLDEARRLGFKAVHGITSLEAVIARGKRLGWLDDPGPYHAMTFIL